MVYISSIPVLHAYSAPGLYSVSVSTTNLVSSATFTVQQLALVDYSVAALSLTGPPISLLPRPLSAVGIAFQLCILNSTNASQFATLTLDFGVSSDLLVDWRINCTGNTGVSAPTVLLALRLAM